MTRRTFSEIQSLRNQLILDRSSHLSNWRSRSKIMSPNRFSDNPSNRNDGGRKDQDMYNSLVRRSLRTFVSGISNGATPRSRAWFKLVSVDSAQGQGTAAKRWFADVERTILAYMQISNMYRVLPAAYKDVAVFSNAAYGMLPHDRFGAHFMPFMIGTYCFSSDSEGNVTTFMRDFNLTIRQTVEVYGSLKTNGHIDWAHFDPWIKEQYQAARYNSSVNLVNTILPNDTPSEKPFFAEDRAYQSYTYVDGAGTNGGTQSPARGMASTLSASQNFLSVKGYDYFPVICPRWEVAPERDYGDESPGCIAEGDARMLQTLELDHMEAVDKLIRPPMVGPASLRRTQASILAGGITYLDEQDSSKQFRPAFTVEPKIIELLNRKEECRQDIKSAFYEDLFLMLADERSVSHVSAREIEEKASEKLSAIGPMLGQLDQDQNRPVIENFFRILSAQGRLPKKPDELRGREIRPEYISVLAQAQKASLVTSTEKLVGFVAQTAEAFGDKSLLKLIKTDKLVRQYAEFVGVDPALIRDETEFEEIQQAQAKLDAAARQAEQQKIQSESIRNLGSAKVGEGSALDLAQQQQAV